MLSDNYDEKYLVPRKVIFTECNDRSIEPLSIYEGVKINPSNKSKIEKLKRRQLSFLSFIKLYATKGQLTQSVQKYVQEYNLLMNNMKYFLKNDMNHVALEEKLIIPEVGCRYVNLGEIINDKYRVNKDYFHKLSPSYKNIFLFELISLRGVKEYEPTNVRNYFFQLYTKQFNKLTQKEKVDNLIRAGFINMEFKQKLINLEMPIEFNRSGEIEKAHIKGTEKFWSPKEECVTINDYQVRITDFYQSLGDEIIDNLTMSSVQLRFNCLINVYGRKIPAAANSKILFSPQGWIIELSLKPKTMFMSEFYNVIASINPRKLSTLKFTPYDDVFANPKYAAHPISILNVSGFILYNGKFLRIEDNSSLALDEKTRRVSNANLMSEIVFNVGLSTVHLSGVTSFELDKISSSHISRPSYLNLKGVIVRLKDHSKISFNLNHTIKTFSNAEDVFLLNEFNEETFYPKGTVITLNSLGFVKDYTLSPNSRERD